MNEINVNSQNELIRGKKKKDNWNKKEKIKNIGCK